MTTAVCAPSDAKALFERQAISIHRKMMYPPIIIPIVGINVYAPTSVSIKYGLNFSRATFGASECSQENSASRLSSGKRVGLPRCESCSSCSLCDGKWLAFLYTSSRLSELGKTLDAAQLLRDTNQAEFLFKPDIEAFLLGFC
jgi:hypothetical protein